VEVEDTFDGPRTSESTKSSDPTSPSGICFETEISKGETLIDVGHMEEGMEMLARALSLAERLHGPEDERVAQILVTYGAAYGKAGEAEKMREVLERALRIFEGKYGATHIKIAMALDGLGQAYYKLGERYLLQARALLERALSIQEAHWGRDHPVLGVTLTNLGNAFGGGIIDKSCRYKRADCYDRALQIKAATHGPDHMETAMARFNYALALWALNSDSTKGYGNNLPSDNKAIEEMKRAKKALSDALGPENPIVLRAAARIKKWEPGPLVRSSMCTIS
jgi:tetratricopeptide (TPR) repeat protein